MVVYFGFRIVRQVGNEVDVGLMLPELKLNDDAPNAPYMSPLTSKLQDVSQNGAYHSVYSDFMEFWL